MPRLALLSRNRADTAPPARGEEAPYLQARAEWDSWHADRAKRERRGWWVAIALLASNLALVAGFILFSYKHETVPYIIRENDLGELSAWGPAEQFQKLSHRQLVAELSRFIRAARSITSDTAVQAQWINETYAFVSRDVAHFLNGYYNENNPYVLARDQRRNVYIESILPISPNTAQVDWIEETRSARGNTVSRVTWRALITHTNEPPTSMDHALINPSGLLITHLAWSPLAEAPSEDD